MGVELPQSQVLYLRIESKNTSLHVSSFLNSPITCNTQFAIMFKIQCKYKGRYTLSIKGQLLRLWTALLALSTFGSDKWFKRQKLWAVASLRGSFNRVYKTLQVFARVQARGAFNLASQPHKRCGNTESRKTVLINFRQAVSRETIKLKPKIKNHRC